MVKLDTAITVVLVIVFLYIEAALTIVYGSYYFEYIVLSLVNFLWFVVLYEVFTSGKD